jgi:hypothetical protein
MPKAQKFLANPSGIHKRVLYPSSLSSANASRKPFLRSRAAAKFVVVFEGCSGEAPHCADADAGKIRSLWADILWTC